MDIRSWNQFEFSFHCNTTALATETQCRIQHGTDILRTLKSDQEQEISIKNEKLTITVTANGYRKGTVAMLTSFSLPTYGFYVAALHHTQMHK